MEAGKTDKILVRGVNWIGDAVMTMPALRSLKLANPGSRITLLVKPWVSALFEKDPSVDEILLYSDEHRGIAGRFRLAKEIRKRGFSAAFLFQNAMDAAIITLLAGVPERVGYARDGRGLLLTKAVSFDRHAKGLHHVDYYLNMLEQAGISPVKSMPWIYLSTDERVDARDRLAALKRPVVAINPGAAFGSSKRWTPERFAGVAGRVIDDLGGSAVIFGGPSERGIAEEIVTMTGSKTQLLNMASETSLRGLAAMISECDVLVTNDSGPMHIGYAVGTPVVAIFGSTSPELTGPVGYENSVIRKEVECAPCFERECKKGGLKCMNAIEPEEVFQSVRRFIKTGRAIFLDRDGTLCRDAHYLSKMEDLEIFPGITSLKRLREKGFSLIGITNQSGIARGIVDEGFVKKVNNIFMDSYGFAGFYYCPHHPDERCSCRKPEPGLLFQARKDFGVNLKESFVIGDKEIDMLLAKSVGAKGVLVKTGKEEFTPHADFIADNLEGAVEFILGS